MDIRDPPLNENIVELAFALDMSEEDLALNAALELTAGEDKTLTTKRRALLPQPVGVGGAAVNAGVSTTNVELVIRGVGENETYSFDGMAYGDAAATGNDSNMPNDNRDGSDPSRTSSTINSHQDQWTSALVRSATHRSERRRRCRRCHKWWRSSAGGKSGVFSVVLAVIILLYAAFVVASPFVANALFRGPVAETYLQVNMSAKIVVGLICGLLIFFAAWTIHRITCARKSTLEDIAKTAEARRHSKWLVIRMFELVLEGIGPNSP